MFLLAGSEVFDTVPLQVAMMVMNEQTEPSQGLLPTVTELALSGRQLFRRLSHASASMIIHTDETANSSLIQLVRITGVESNLRWIPAVTRKLIHVIKL